MQSSLTATGFLFALLAAATVSGQSTAHYWQLDEASGDLLDVVGSADLTGATGLTYAQAALVNPVPNPDAGPFSSGDTEDNPGAVAFSGSGGIGASTTDAALLDAVKVTSANSFTVEGWLQTTATQGLIAGDRQAGSSPQGWSCFLNTNGSLRLFLNVGANLSVSSSTVVNDGVPHHFAMVWDHLAGEFRLYIDGNLEGTLSPASVGSYTSGGFAIGATAAQSDLIYDDNVFNGALDELRVSGVALAPTEFLNHGAGTFLETGFEGSSSLPGGWTQTQISGSASWSVRSGTPYGGPSSAHSGSNNLSLYEGFANGCVTRLISPTFNTTGYINLSLKFWHTQPFWSPYQDELKVLFSSDGGANWTELAHYTQNIPDWTQETLNLPAASANSRIAFEGHTETGSGVSLDDILLTGIPETLSEVSVTATDGDASELGTDAGTWTITRAGNTSGPLDVHFSLSGSATAHSDYNLDTASPITFAADETSKVVTLTPVDDSESGEGDEIATLTLALGTGYAIDPLANSADISIIDDEGYDHNILVIGSTHSFSEGGEHDVVHGKPFNPSAIASHLQSILRQDPAISETVKVAFEDIYKTKSLSVNYTDSVVFNFTSHCYSLAQHYMWPEGRTERLADLRGEGETEWDTIVLCADPYILANFPGMFAEGVKLIQQEVARSANPAQIVLLAQWPENSSGFSADDFNEVVHRVGDSAGLTVVPAGKVWDSYASQDTASAHPTPRGEYLAAAALYSKLTDRSAGTSGYEYPSDGDTIADHALAVVQSIASTPQYTGAYTGINTFQMKDVRKRLVNYRETGTSTENKLGEALYRLDDVMGIQFGTSGYSDPGGTRWDFNYGRGNDWGEDNKDYEVNPGIYDRSYGFPMQHYTLSTAPNTMPYGIDKHYRDGSSYDDGTDLGIAYNMVRPNTRETGLPEGHDVRAIPVRLMWLKMREISPGFHPLEDVWHMSPHLNDASAAFMYTLLSGRCPVVEEPATQGSTEWLQWLGHKIGYETAWQMSHLTTRAPGFRVLPSGASATSVTPGTSQTMTVQFAHPPQAEVTVTVSSVDPTAAIVSPPTLTFTPTDYNTPRTVTVTGLPGAIGTESFDVVFQTSSEDAVFDGLSDSWSFTNTRSSTESVTQVDNGTAQVDTNQYTPVDISLGVVGATSGNTVFAGPTHGSITWSGSADIQYTPNGSYLGSDQMVYAVTLNGTQTIGTIELTVLLPDGQVDVTAGDAQAAEEGADPGSWIITRSGDTAAALDVYFTLGGSATANDDYTLDATSPVNIPIGQSSVTVTLSPVDDENQEGGETAVLTLVADDAYLIGAGSDTITLTENDSLYVSYDGNGSDGGTVPTDSSSPYNQGSTVIVPGPGTLTKNGSDFLGWNTAPDGSGTTYVEGHTFTITADTTLYAQWWDPSVSIAWVTDQAAINSGWKNMLEGAGYTVTYFGASYEDIDATEAATLNTYNLVIASGDADLGTGWELVTVPMINLNPYRINELGWISAEGDLRSQGTSVSVLDASDPIWTSMGLSNGDSVQLWTSNVRFNADSVGNLLGNPSHIASKAGDSNDVGIVRWGAGALPDGEGPRMQWRSPASGDLDAFTLTAAGQTAFLNAVANFTNPPIPASTVTFDANGGDTPVPGSKVVIHETTYGTLATTSRSGYNFAGWFTAPTGDSEVTDATTVSTASDHTLYAQWTPSTSYADYAGDNGGSTTDPTADDNSNGVQDGLEYAFYESLGDGVRLDSAEKLGQVIFGVLDEMGTPNEPGDDHIKYAILLPENPPADVIYRVYASSVAPLDAGAGKTLLASYSGGGSGSWTMSSGASMETGPNAEDIIVDPESLATTERRFIWVELEIATP